MKHFIIVMFLLLACYSIHAQTFASAHEINARLGKGINMGNTFEAPSETAWSNPWKPEYFRIMSELGFSHVRIPIRWSTDERSMNAEPYTIYPAFLERIKEVIETALMYNLLPVINMHHHQDLFDDPEGQKDRFMAQWRQIAEYFKDYPDSLVFEVLNEPNNNLTAALWNVYFAEALELIRESNPERIVMVGTAEWGGLGGLSKLELPVDDRLILTIHYYNPFQFTHQGASWSGDHTNEWLGTEWKNTETERQTIIDEFRYAISYSEEHNIPIHVGEFGAYSTADIDSRERWTTFLARWFDEQGFSWAYWEFSAGFGIYNPNTKQFLMSLVNALLHNEMPEPVGQIVTPVFESIFENSAEGWSLQTHGGALAELVVVDNSIKVEITNGATEGWHVQLVRNGVRLAENSMYRARFNATSAHFPRSFTTYAGRASDPWNSYSGYSGVTLTDNQYQNSFSFTMSNSTDNNARIVFDLGGSDIDVYLSYFILEELAFESNSVLLNQSKDLRYYPNPASTFLRIENIEKYNYLSIFDMKGSLKRQYNINNKDVELSIDDLPAGLYLVNVANKSLSNSFRFLKI